MAKDLSSEADELLIFLDNDEPLYRRKKEFLKNVHTKMKRGTYSPVLARNLWMYYVEESAKKYGKEFLNPGDWSRVFPPAVRREVAQELEARERRMIEAGEYQDFPPVTKARRDSSAKRRKSATRRDAAPNINPVCPVGTQVQTVILSQQYFNQREATSWIRRQGFRVSKIDETSNSWRFRQQNPNEFDRDSFRTIRLRPGVTVVIGCPL